MRTSSNFIHKHISDEIIYLLRLITFKIAIISSWRPILLTKMETNYVNNTMRKGVTLYKFLVLLLLMVFLKRFEGIL